MRAWQKRKGAAQRNSVPPLLFLVGQQGAEPAYLSSLFCCFAAGIFGGSAQGLFCIVCIIGQPRKVKSRRTGSWIMQAVPAQSEFGSRDCQILTQCVNNLPQTNWLTYLQWVDPIISHYVNIVFGLFILAARPGKTTEGTAWRAAAGEGCGTGRQLRGVGWKRLTFFLQLKSSFEKKMGIFKMRSLNKMNLLEKV